MPFLICVAFVTRHSNGYVYFWERFISINSCIKITCYNNYDYTWRFEFQCWSFPSSDDIFFPEKSSCFLEGPINSLNEKKADLKLIVHVAREKYLVVFISVILWLCALQGFIFQLLSSSSLAHPPLLYYDNMRCVVYASCHVSFHSLGETTTV